MASDKTCGLVLRPLGQFDLPIAAALHARCFDEAWKEKDLADLLAMPGSFGFVADVAKQPAGLVMALAVSVEAEILTLCVVPECRRLGIGRRLLARVSAQLLHMGCSRLILEVADDNLAASRLYERAGFEEVGRRPGYYRRANGKEANAVVLAKVPGSEPH